MEVKSVKLVLSRICFPLGIGAALLALAQPCVAQNLIKSPTAHPQYLVELEPHLVLNFIGDDGLGLGGRATFVVMDPGFVTSINNNIGIGVGIDWMDGGDHCHPGGCYDDDRFVLPAVLQWNFWFTPHWSAFGEPGIAVKFHDHNNNNNDTDLDVALYVGGRFNFNDDIALTLRLGTPASSFGVSFFL
jgi:hypothetical protein